MAQANESEDSIRKKHEELCAQLNVDPEATEESWKSYETISQKYTLDGEPIHWIGCALFVACRKSLVPTVDHSGSTVEGNCVNLTKLLRLCNITLIKFFDTIKKWMEMASMPEDFRLRVEKLKRNYSVSSILFDKLKPIFLQLFLPLENIDTTKSTKGNKKLKITPCTLNSLFEMCWMMFVCVKGEFPYLTDDLVNMYHVLLCTMDLMFGNAIVAQRRDLINPSFEGVPPNWSSPNFEPLTEPPCVISILCNIFNGLELEAMYMKHYTWRPVITKFFKDSILKGDEMQLTGLLDLSTFDANLKSLNVVYETYVLSVGEFDERIFLSERESPTKDEISKSTASVPSTHVRSLAEDTPLTGRRYLKHKEFLTPVSNITHSVEQLKEYLIGCTNAPSASLLAIVKDCPKGVVERMIGRQKELSAQFLAGYTALSSPDMAATRLNLAEELYYRLLEKIIVNEIRKKPQINLESLMSQEMFHQTLFACCVEMVVHTYSCQNARFPWVLDCLQLYPFYFYKIIELVVLVIKEKLSRDVVKHLNAIEEQVLESLAWTSRSPIWELIRANTPLPQWSEVCAPEPASFPSPVPRRHNNHNSGVTQSPVSSVSDRFSSPGTELAKKQLFKDSITIRPGQSLLNQNLNNQVNLSPTNGRPACREPQPLKKVIKGGSLGLFLRKFYSLAVVRMDHLCEKLKLMDQELKQKVWTCLEHAIIQETHLMMDRHLDQILMCSIYVICKVSNETRLERTFTEIMRCYRQQPQATAHVYRSVLISSEPDRQPNNNENRAAAIDVVGAVPPPGQVAGQSPRHPLQVRGDLIMFYNTVYVRCLQQFALRFSPTQNETCPLSPVPLREGDAAQHNPRRVSEQHHLYVRPLAHGIPPSAHALTSITYRFSRSPAKDLQEINCLMSQESMSLKRAAEGGVTASPACQPVSRMIHSLISDRQTQP